MRRTKLLLMAGELETRLLPLLLGRVSHVTSQSALACILRDGELRPGMSASRSYGADKSAYFRSRDCLSLTDLRSITSEQVDEGLKRFYFLNPPLADSTNRPVFFLFTSAVHEALIPWSAWRERTSDQGVRIAAPTEAGYPSAIPLSLVEEVIEVEVSSRGA